MSAELSDKDPQPKADKHEEVHNNEPGAGVPEKPEAGDHQKDSQESPAAKLFESLSKTDWEAMGNKALKAVGNEARSILGLNPLGDAADKKLEGEASKHKSSTATLEKEFKFDLNSARLSDFRNFSNESSHYFGGKLPGCFADPFEGGRKVDGFDKMGFAVNDLDFSPNRNNNSMWGNRSDFRFDGMNDKNSLFFGNENIFNNVDYKKTGEVDFKTTADTGFFNDSVRDIVDNNRKEASSKGFFGNMFETIKQGWEKATALSNVAIDWVGSQFKTHDTPGGKVETRESATGREFKTGDADVTQSKVDKQGRHETEIKTSDGTDVKHERNGDTTVTNKDSKLSVKRNAETGKVEALDASGKPIATFDSEKEAAIFLNNSLRQIVKPGQTLDQAYEEALRDPQKKAFLENKPMFAMDGQGNSLTVQPDGTRHYTRADGSSETIMPHKGPDGKDNPIHVKVTTGPDGKEHFTLSTQGGKPLELSSQDAHDLMRNSRLKLDAQGNLMINDDRSGKPEQAAWHQLRRNHKLHVAPGMEVDTQSGQAKIDDGQTVSVITPNKNNGVITEQQYAKHEDGTVDKNPTRVITENHGETTIQGFNPETGEKVNNDVIKFNSNDGTVDAFNHVKLNPDNTTVVTTDDGNKFTIDKIGDIKATDKDDKDLFQTKGDDVSYDGGESYEHYTERYEEQKAEEAVQEAVSTAAEVGAAAAALIASLNISAGQIDALDQQLGAALANLPPGFPIPAQVSAARAQIAAARARLDQDNSVDSNLEKIAGVNNDTLTAYARESGTGDAFQAANYALKRAGYHTSDEKSV
ncbi:MAG: hypothetical protein K2X27_00220 [Candidatus Obscuribacterales bacterium]|nr:hypothetical protein [Candidatus Obscuribacterales bacterium]